MKSDLHMSKKQAKDAMVIVENKLFDRKGKFHEECENKVELNTLPQERNIRQVGKSTEAIRKFEQPDYVIVLPRSYRFSLIDYRFGYIDLDCEKQ